MTPIHTDKKMRSTPLLCVSVLSALIGVVGDSASSAQTTAPAGLNALTDEPLYAELAARGQDALLDRAFDENHVPANRREPIRALGQLRRLAADAAKLRPAERQAAAGRIAQAIAPIVGTIDEPAMLAGYADALLAAGVLPEVNTLEYWGPSVTTQAQLRPIVQTTIALLDRAVARAGEAASKLADVANPNNAAQGRELERLEALTNAGNQNRALAGYYLALCLDPIDPKRAEAADRAIAFLSEYDDDANPARLNLKLALGKLQSVRGDFAAARAALDVVADAPPPAQGAAISDVAALKSLVFQGKYFRAVVEVLARDAGAARQRYDALIAWEKSAGLADPSVETANELLEYRLLALAPGNASRDRGNALLTKLIDQRPELSALILAQLRSGIAPDATAKSLDAIQLRAVLSAAQEQVARRERDATFKPDAQALSRGLDAANELIARGDRPDADPRLVLTSRFLTGAFLELLDRRAEAATAFLDFVDAAKDQQAQKPFADAALSNAQRLFAQLGGLDANDPRVAALYDRILPLAIAAPFNQKELNFDWALRLQQRGDAAAAIPFFRAVAADDRRYAASRYFLLVALAQQLDATKPADRPAALAEIQSLADEVRTGVDAALAAAPDDATRATLRQRGARTTILAADLARREGNDPGRAAKLLDGIDERLNGLPDATRLLGEAMFIRVQADMQQGRTDEAVKGLVSLLDRSGGGQGAQIVFNMLGQLERDFAAAQATNDRARMATLQAGRAALTPYLVKWAESSPQADVKASAYRYRVYDAETQRLAAEFLDGPARDAKRAEARQRFEQLDSDEGRKQFEASRPANAGRSVGYDPQVALGLARLAFDAGETSKARDAYARLLADRALGTAVAVVSDAGAERQVDNDAFWEATLRYVQTALDLNDPIDPLRQVLAEQQVRWGDRAGGKTWRGLFESLAKRVKLDATTALDTPR